MKKWCLGGVLCVLSAWAMAQGTVARTLGQSLYLPIYSHIWHGDIAPNGARERTLLSVAVSIRNTDVSKPIRITSAQYFDTNGRRVRDFVDAPKTIAPMGTLELFVPRGDDTGGAGANFIIVWKSDSPANAPLVEGVHANVTVGRSMVFVTSARALAD